MKFLQVRDEHGQYFGGNQAWFRSRTKKGYGCGIIACANTIFCLKGKRMITQKNYMELAERLSKKYFHALPILGINGFALMIGMNRYFRKEQMPYRARWGCLPGNIWKRMEEMLSAGVSPVLAIGPTWPFVFRNVKLDFYEEKNVKLKSRTRTKCHYVSITDLDEEWITISSWGKRYYVLRSDYETYMRKYSNILYSNILYIFYSEPQENL